MWSIFVDIQCLHGDIVSHLHLELDGLAAGFLLSAGILGESPHPLAFPWVLENQNSGPNAAQQVLYPPSHLLRRF